VVDALKMILKEVEGEKLDWRSSVKGITAGSGDAMKEPDARAGGRAEGKAGDGAGD